MPVLKRASGITYVHGGNPHSGWLPPGAATPPPEPIRLFTLDVTIEADPGGYLLIYCSREEDGFAFDDWFENLADAEKAAQEKFGIGTDRWEVVQDD